MNKIENYVLKHYSQKIYITNKIRITIIKEKSREIYHFNAEDGSEFIDFLIENIDVNSNNSKNLFDNKYFKNSELPPYKNQLEAYSGREWMNEK